MNGEPLSDPPRVRSHTSERQDEIPSVTEPKAIRRTRNPPAHRPPAEPSLPRTETQIGGAAQGITLYFVWQALVSEVMDTKRRAKAVGATTKHRAVKYQPTTAVSIQPSSHGNCESGIYG